MPDADTQNRPAAVETVAVLPTFIAWYYGDHPGRIIRSYLQYAGAFGESFSMFFLLKTLFEPWKSIKDNYPDKGFNMQAILETLFLNMTTRGIGAFIRLSAILTGLLIQLSLLAGFLLWLAVWMAFPLIVVIGLPALFLRSFS